MILTIRLKGVSKTYTSKRGQRVAAVESVDLSITAGEVFGIIGYSGAGKSTLLRCINLLERPTVGEVEVDGQPLLSMGKRDLQHARRKIGMIFQHFHLLHTATVHENIAFPLRLAGVPRNKAADRVRELLGLVGLDGYEGKYPAQLSGGQKQRVAIARALANDPKVLLCDEATSALDPQTTRSILDLLLEINKRLQVTVVIVTHEMGVVQRVCDRVAVMDNGRVVESGKVSDVFLSPRHEMTRRLLEVDTAAALSVSGLSEGKWVEVTFLGESTYSPVLFEVAQATGTSFSILRGTVDMLKDQPFGKLVVAWTGTEEMVAAALALLVTHGCEVHDVVQANERSLKHPVEVEV
jgi:D-methionine transport system ATP-binding protein